MIRKRIQAALLALAGTICLSAQPAAAGKPALRLDADVVVYGGTPAGLAAATAIARGQRSVVVIEPTLSIGGMITGGIACTDTGTPQFVGGIAREFFDEVASVERRSGYRDPASIRFHGSSLGWAQPRVWDLEPKIARQVFEAWMRKEKIEVILKRQILSVSKTGTRIRSIRLANGLVVSGRIFIDASYEGDLMAKAHVSSTFGRESGQQYGESLAGVRAPHFVRNYTEAEFAVPTQEYMHHGQFSANLPARDRQGRLLWGVEAGPLGAPGSGDDRLQAYCYRLIATQRADLEMAWPRPGHYDASHYALLLEYIRAHPGMTFTRLVHLAPLPNGKWDLNASGPFSIDLIGGNKEYPAETYAERGRSLVAHKEYEQGFLWFLAHDPRVPQPLRDEVNSWGMAKDEWQDSGHWPAQIYIRESRRMIGAYVMTQKDILEDNSKPDSIGLGSFVLDSHWVRRFEEQDGFVKVEGNLDESIDLSKHPYEIPYRAIVPKPQEAENLLVPVCLSASHVAMCTIRMEPVYMILGEAAGQAALLALQEKTPVQRIDTQALMQALAAHGGVLSADRQIH